jgi:hypothetical protein
MGGENLYGMVYNDPMNWVDYNGLYVVLCFAYKEGKVIGFDKDDPTKKIEIDNVFSGNAHSNDPNYQHVEDKGPIPEGEYWIGNEYKHGNSSTGNYQWNKLYGDDGNGGKSYRKVVVPKPGGGTVTRGGFNLHTGRASNGCITCRSDVGRNDPNYPQSKKYDKLQDFINKSKKPFTNPRKSGDTYKGIFLVKKCIKDCEKALKNY